MMRLFLAIAAATFSLAGAAFAADPVGEWRTANGAANIRIDDCDGALWGVISWEKAPGVDANNPNPAERSRPTLGLHIILAMRSTKPGLWEGQVYNAQNGKTYTSKLSLTSPDVLRIEGCVLGFLCGGESWTRVKAEAAPPTLRTPPAAPPRGTSRPAAAPAAPPPTAMLSACSGIPDGAGTSHKGGLK